VSDERPGWMIVLRAFLAAPDRSLTNHELGALYGVQAFRSRISDLRAMGCDITQGTYIARGHYRYRLESWPPALLEDPGSDSASSSEAVKPEPAFVGVSDDGVELGLFDVPADVDWSYPD
jgi:hypothetical protein